MSFQPAALGEVEMAQLEYSFRQAMDKVVGRNLAPGEGRAFLLHAFKCEGWRAPEKPRRLLESKTYRRQLWGLLSAQIQSGIAIRDALANIRKERVKLGFPETYDEALDDWNDMMEKGLPFSEFFVVHVMPVDFSEGARLAMGSMLSSFQDVLKQEADRYQSPFES